MAKRAWTTEWNEASKKTKGDETQENGDDKDIDVEASLEVKTKIPRVTFNESYLRGTLGLPAIYAEFPYRMPVVIPGKEVIITYHLIETNKKESYAMYRNKR